MCLIVPILGKGAPSSPLPPLHADWRQPGGSGTWSGWSSARKCLEGPVGDGRESAQGRGRESSGEWLGRWVGGEDVRCFG